MLSIILRFHVSHLSSKISRKGQKTTFCKTGKWPERHRKIHFSHTFRRRRQQWLNLSRLILLENKLVFLCTNLNYSSWEIAWQHLDFLQQFSKMGDAITRLRWLSVSDHVPTFCPKSLISVGRPGIEKIENKSGETDCVRSYHVILTILHTGTIWLFCLCGFTCYLLKRQNFYWNISKIFLRNRFLN